MYFLRGLLSTDCWKWIPVVSATEFNLHFLYKSALTLNDAPAKLSISIKPVNYN